MSEITKVLKYKFKNNSHYYIKLGDVHQICNIELITVVLIVKIIIVSRQ